MRLVRLAHLATDMGDILCVTAVAIVVGFWCWRQLDRLSAAAFALAYLTALTLTTGLKIISAQLWAGPHDSTPMQLSSGAPSGHVVLSIVVYGSAAYFCGRASRAWYAWLGQIVCVLVLVGVAVTRVTLHTHTVADVLSGAGIGLALIAAPLFLVWSRPQSLRGSSAQWLLAGMVAAAAFMLLSGVRMPSGDFNLA